MENQFDSEIQSNHLVIESPIQIFAPPQHITHKPVVLMRPFQKMKVGAPQDNVISSVIEEN